MYGKAYKSGRRVQRHTGGGGSMKPTNFSEALFGLLVLAVLLASFAACAAPFV
jgi:hypothetical protein